MPQVAYIDRSREQLAAALTPRVVEDAHRYAFDQLIPFVEKAVIAQGNGARSLAGQAAANVLKSAITSVTQSLCTESNGYNSLRWLWLLRRVPKWIFKGDYLTTAGYDCTLAEVLSGNATGRSRATIDNNVYSYPIDGTIVRRVARYCASTKFLSDLHSDYRLAGKGALFEFRRNQKPQRIVDNSFIDSVHLYDDRAELGGGGRMGTEVLGPSRSSVKLRELLPTLDGDPSDLYFRLNTLASSIELAVPRIDADLGSGPAPTAYVRANFMLVPAPLENLRTLMANAPPSEPIFDRNAAALLFVSIAATIYIFEHLAGLKGAMESGYLLFAEAAFRDRLAYAFASMMPTIKKIVDIAGISSSGEMFDIISGIGGRAWPLEAGPLIRQDGAALALDLAGTSRRLDALVYPTSTGALGVCRA